MAKRKAAKSPDKPPKAPKEPKTSAPPVSGILVAVEGGGLAFSPAPTRKKLVSEPTASSSSVTFPASQDTTTSEGITSTTPRNISSTIKPELEQKPLSLPFPPAFRHEDASSEEACLIPTTLPPHVEHAANTTPTLSQTLDKEPSRPPHAPTHVEHTPASNPNPDQTTDQAIETYSTPKLLFILLQGQQALLSNAAKMERDIASLKNENDVLRTQLQTSIGEKIDRLAIHLTDNLKHLYQAISNNQETTSKSNEDIQEHIDFRSSEQFTINKGRFDHLEESITSVNGKLSSMEGTLEKLQTPAQIDSPMDMTPVPHPSKPLPSASPTSQPLYRQSARPTYANVAGSQGPNQQHSWSFEPTPPPRPIIRHNASPENSWVIRFPSNGKFGSLTSAKRNTLKREAPPHLIISLINKHPELPKIKAIRAKWTQKDNLSITFSQESTEKDIMDASKTIIKCLKLDDQDTILSKAVNWSKIVFKNTPCQTFHKGDNDSMSVTKITDTQTLLEAVRESHPLLEKATFIHPPDWTVRSLPKEAIYHNLRFTIEDPDNSIAENLITSNVTMFATTIRPRLWKDNPTTIATTQDFSPY